jgi:hypothetical protein
MEFYGPLSPRIWKKTFLGKHPMFLPFRMILFIFAVVAGLATSFSVFADDDVYDRLDGTGPSGKKVDIIEWDGNLEVHVSPKTSIGGLGAKLDDRTGGKTVMVLGLRFKGQPNVLVRRAILGVPFNPKLKGFMDPTEKDYDKLALSNQDLPAPWKPYKLDTPDGDERNLTDPATAPTLSKRKNPDSSRNPASVDEQKQLAPRDEGSLNHYNW